MAEATIIVIFTTSFVVALSGALMPGPLLALTIGETCRRGFWAGPLLVLGHGILELAVVIGLALGLSQFLVKGIVSGITGVAGGIMLFAMGLAIIRKSWQGVTMPLACSPDIGQDRKIVLSGILGSVSNPYWVIWWATIGMTYLSWSLRVGTEGIASFFTGHILADLVWYTLVAFIITTGKKVMNDAIYRWLLVLCGISLVVLGGYFLVSGIKFLTS